MIFDGLSDEEIDKYIQKDTYVMMKCERCGYEEKVPTWVLAEFQDIERYKGNKNPKRSCLCIKCQKVVCMRKRNNSPQNNCIYLIFLYPKLSSDKMGIFSTSTLTNPNSL